MIRAPAESMNQKIGNSSRSATSVIRMIFSTVRAPQEPALTLGSFATTRAGSPVNQPAAGDNAVGGQIGRHRIGELAILHESAVVEQQVDPLADEELVRTRLSLAAARSVGARVRSRAALMLSMIDYSTGSPSRRAISSRCTSEVPSPISKTFASR